MPLLTKPTQLTSLLDNQVLARVERLRLNPTRRFTNRTQGEHLAGKGGTSNEFSDYRDYVPGDDVRFVDWNIFSRLHRPYLKLYQYEEEMHVVILLDASSSMVFDDKLLRAKQVAAAVGVMGLLNVERVSVYASHDQSAKLSVLPPCTGRVSLKRLLDFLETVDEGGDCPLEVAIERMLRQHRGRGVVVLLSDFLTFGNVHRALNMLFSAGLEIFALQLLGPSEVAPEVAGDLRLVDTETGATLDVSNAVDLLSIYQEHRVLMEEELALACRKRGGRFLTVDSSLPLEILLFDRLLRRGWIR